MSFIKILARLFERSTGAPKDVKYIPVQNMLKSIENKKRFVPHASDTWEPTQAQLDAAKVGTFSMKDFVKKILNQGGLGACTAFGWAGAIAVMHAIRNGMPVWLSTLFIYYYERLINGTVNQDSGADVKDGASVLSTRGAPLESSYPYSDDGQTFKEEPPASLDAEAAKYKVVSPLKVAPKVSHIKAALKAEMPVVFGFLVYSSFEDSETSRTGIVKMPEDGEAMVGGHCVFAIGYTDSTGAVKFFRTADAVRYRLSRMLGSVSHALRLSTGLTALSVTPPADCLIGVNSWGRRWGDGGLFYMPWTYVTKYASDFYLFTDVTK
jgi:C1A family cysteine protease